MKDNSGTARLVDGYSGRARTIASFLPVALRFMLEAVVHEQAMRRTSLLRVQELVELRRSGGLTIQQFARQLKSLSTEELVDLSSLLISHARRDQDLFTPEDRRSSR